MELSPVYDTPGFLRFEGSEVDPAVPMLRQRRRMAAMLADLEDDQWAAPSRCDGWSVHDVVTHLVTVNRFWALSIETARRGEPTRLLAGFDPVASPAAMVADVRDLPPATTLERFVASNEAIAAAVDGMAEDEWSKPGEAPPGHIPLRGVAMHALWDAWIHERDVMVPLGLTPVDEADEVAECLRYVVALGPAFAVAYGSTRRGAIFVAVTDPDVRIVVDVAEGVLVHDGDAPRGALRVSGAALDVLDGLSFRGPWEPTVHDDDRWLVGGLATAFDREPIG